ncbi:sensor domain-containing diguanylate cyclase [Succinimonas amylolytica]|uniref:sensor domain-containing diguanylate cyclase n=1 Tax=Succinimonas amylolytica TaxID=83769 RepID=UPI000381C8C5|nr:diguanylate cyclase [Succinimonas amylolytica]
MNSKNDDENFFRAGIWEALVSLGIRNILIALSVIFFTVVALSLGFYALYSSVKESISLRSEINARQFSKDFDEYLLTGLNNIKMASYTVDTMLKSSTSSDEIRRYLVQASDNIKSSIDSDSTGLYGLVNDTFVDGSGWVPDADYDPRNRPWYQETMENGTPITFVKPYVDMQTGNYMMTITGLLGDGKSVIAIDVGLREVQDITERIGQSVPGCIGMVLDNSGGVVAHSDRQELEREYLEEANTLGGLIARKIFRDNNTQFEVQFGESSYMVYAEPLVGGWVSVSAMDTAELFKLPRFIMQFSVVVVLLSIVFIFIIVAKIARRNLVTQKLNMQLSSVGAIYVSIYDIDVSGNTCCEICYHSLFQVGKISSGQDRSGTVFAGRGGDFALIGDAQTGFFRMAEESTAESSRKSLRQFVDFSTLNERMNGVNTITEEFLDSGNKWCRGRFVVEKRDSDGRISHVLWLVESIDREKRNREKLRYLAETDMMTGICNRGTGERKVSAMLMEKQCGMFILLDIDKFKTVNDSFGHQVGDQVITSVAGAMKNTFRDYDVLMRLGGDEFAVFAPGVCSVDKAQMVISRFFHNVQTIRIPEMGDRSVYVSVGATFYDGSGEVTFQELYEQADGCTYMSKKTVGNTITYFGS